MTESDYFGHLEYRICGELSGMRRKDLRRLWCDGVVATGFEVIDGRAQIVGWAFMFYDCSPRERIRKEQITGYWDFVLLIGSESRDCASVEWDKLLPAPDVTGWLSLDFDSKKMIIDPLSAYPDPKPATV